MTWGWVNKLAAVRKGRDLHRRTHTSPTITGPAAAPVSTASVCGVSTAARLTCAGAPHKEAVSLSCSPLCCAGKHSIGMMGSRKDEQQKTKDFYEKQNAYYDGQAEFYKALFASGKLSEFQYNNYSELDMTKRLVQLRYLGLSMYVRIRVR